MSDNVNITVRKNILTHVRRVVIKIGSRILTNAVSGDGEQAFLNITQDINTLIEKGCEVIIVSSGAIALGMHKLGFAKKPVAIPERQASAATGQPALMQYYEDAFSKFGKKTAQILLTYADLANRLRFLNAKNTICALLDYKVIPIINENDTVSVEEIKLGDNDNLSAMVATLTDADLLILLSDVDGFYKCNPKDLPPGEKPISVIENIDSEIEKCALGAVSAVGTGGMITKIQAAKKAAHRGAVTIIANGSVPHILQHIFDGADVGTIFLQKKDKVKGKKHWIAFTLKPQGKLTIDNGGVSAIINDKKSLLPSGIVSISGRFAAGCSVSLVTRDGEEFARGLVNYSSEELNLIKGLNSKKIIETLGYKHFDEVINRDELIVL